MRMISSRRFVAMQRIAQRAGGVSPIRTPYMPGASGRPLACLISGTGRLKRSHAPQHRFIHNSLRPTDRNTALSTTQCLDGLGLGRRLFLSPFGLVWSGVTVGGWRPYRGGPHDWPPPRACDCCSPDAEYVEHVATQSLGPGAHLFQLRFRLRGVAIAGHAAGRNNARPEIRLRASGKERAVWSGGRRRAQT